MSDKETSSPIEKLNGILGFDPAANKVEKGIFEEALAEVREQDAQKHKAKAKELIEKGISCLRKWHELDRQFTSEKKKSNKDLNKIISQIEIMAGGGTASTESAE